MMTSTAFLFALITAATTATAAATTTSTMWVSGWGGLS
jgi:hypothetical protein